MITKINQFKNNIYKMKLQLQQLKTRGPAPLISYNPDSTIRMKPDSKLYSMKVDINIQPGDIGRKLILLYVLVFKQGSPQ